MADNTPNLSRLFQTAGTQKQQTGTGFTNLNRLFSANQGNQLGQKVAGNVQKQVGDVQSRLGQQQQEFQTESDKNKLGNEQDIAKRDEIIGRFAPSSGTEDVGSGRSGGTLSDDDVASFGKFTGGQYGGPQGLRDTGSLQNTAAQLKGQVSNFSPAGTQELLRRSVGGNKYTQGQQRLDALLMDKSALTPVQRQAQALGQNIDRANLAASGQAELNKNLAQRFGEETQGKLTAGMTGIDTSVQGQFAAAQDAEAARGIQLQNLMNTLQGDMIPKLDPSGKPVVDENGQPVMERKLTGTTDPYARMDEISKTLKDQNLVNQNQYEALFGKGAFTENKAGYDKNLKDIRQQEVLGSIEQGLGSQLHKAVGDGRGTYMPGVYGSSGQQAIAQSNLNKVQNYMAGKNMDSSNPASYNAALADLYKSGQVSEADILGMKGNYKDSYDRYNFFTPSNQIGGVADTKGAERASALEGFKTATGLAGRSTLDSRQDEFYNTLAKSLGAGTTQAEGLTEAGVASDKQRASYEALNKLMGKTASESKYRTDDPTKYKAGQINLDAAQIKRALGY